MITQFSLRKLVYLSLVIGVCAIAGSWLAAPNHTALAQDGTSLDSSVAFTERDLGEHSVSPHQGSGALSNVTANDIFLPGTQPGGLISNLADSTTCTYCHVDHITQEYGGSMMANSARDPIFRAALQVANRDIPGGGELCLRCHSPNAWLNGRASGEGADGSQLNASDLQGMSCTVCHRMVPPSPIVGESTRDAVEREHIIETIGGTMRGSGAYILDREEYRRGSYQVYPPHATSQSSYMRSAELCGTCHDIDNPLYSYDTSVDEFLLNAVDTPASTDDRLFPIERTYSEWAASDFANGGVTGLDYPGIRRATLTDDGPITVCQDCHMPMVQSPLAVGAEERYVGQHQWAGANSRWQLGIVELWQDVAADLSFNADATHAAAAKGEDFLQHAADMELAIVDNELEVKVINNTGHKLPTGYAEGRRMWLEVTAYISDTAVYTTGVPSNGNILGETKIYEIKQGLTERHATAIGRPELAGESFHFILNNSIVSDNRIPPRGYTMDAFEARDMLSVGHYYPDGQYWDTTRFAIPTESTRVEVRLLFQSASGAYLDFLEAEADVTVDDAVLGEMNWGNTVGQLRRDLTLDEPTVMASGVLTPTFAPVEPLGEKLYLPVVTK